jgi:WhiB family transcriptional regulator, redox-sensing transcriptional regulator
MISADTVAIRDAIRAHLQAAADPVPTTVLAEALADLAVFKVVYNNLRALEHAREIEQAGKLPGGGPALWRTRTPNADEQLAEALDRWAAELHTDDEELEWQAGALCAQTDPEAFFPEKGGSTREAKRICQGCQVRAECLDYALAHDERFGIWGGLSERERRKLKKRAG